LDTVVSTQREAPAASVHNCWCAAYSDKSTLVSGRWSVASRPSVRLSVPCLWL